MATLGERMKRYELAHRHVLPRRTYTVLRVDGRAFHTYLRDAAKPFDARFAADLDVVAEELCIEVQGAVLAYTQSDEVSVVMTDFDTPQTEPWFGGVVAKQVSVAASIATAVLNLRRPEGPAATFDARVFTLADPAEVVNYLIWRQRDAVRNSIMMAGQAAFGHAELQGLSSRAVQEKLWAERDVNWNDFPAGFKRGRLTTCETGERAVEYVDKRTNELVQTTAVRSWWTTDAAPHFTMETLLPRLPVMSPPPRGLATELELEILRNDRARVEALHTQDLTHHEQLRCAHDEQPWPCATWRVLNGMGASA